MDAPARELQQTPDGQGADQSAEAGPLVVLAGSPNVGKSVMFNNLTGLYATVSNYPGTTVEVSRGKGTLGEQAVRVVRPVGAAQPVRAAQAVRAAWRVRLAQAAWAAWLAPSERIPPSPPGR